MMKLSKYIKRPMVVLIVLAVLATCVAGGVLGKFVFQSTGTQTADPEPFYFSCNYDDGGIYYLPGTSTNIEVFNHNHLGNFTASDVKVDIRYVEVDTNDVEIGTPTNVPTITLAGGAERENLSTVINAQKGDRYKVTVTTTSPYEKTVSFLLIFMESDAESFYRITKNGSWLQLDLYIGAEKLTTDLTIDFTGLSPDNTNPFMTEWYGTSGVIDKDDLSDHARYTLIFFGDVGTAAPADSDLNSNTIPLS